MLKSFYVECLDRMYKQYSNICYAGLSPVDVAKGRRVQDVLKGTVSSYCFVLMYASCC